MSELKVPEDLREWYEATAAVRNSYFAANVDFACRLIERIARVEAENATLRQTVADAFDAIFPYVMEAHGEDGNELTIADKINHLAAQLATLRRSVTDNIWFHGTSEENGLSILRDKEFRAGTWFASRMEDAIRFGGLHVFAVRVQWDEPRAYDWQVCASNAISTKAIVGTFCIHSCSMDEDWRSTTDALISARIEASSPGEPETNTNT